MKICVHFDFNVTFLTPVSRNLIKLLLQSTQSADQVKVRDRHQETRNTRVFALWCTELRD